jgi:hypothetical protein
MLVAPLVMRNRLVNGSWTPTRSGLNLYIGNSRFTSSILPDYDVDILQEQANALVDSELSRVPATTPEYSRAADAILSRRAVAYMRERPWETLRQKVLNIGYLFSPRLVPFYVAGSDTRAVDLDGRVVVQHPYPRPMIEWVSYSLFYTPVLFGAVWGVYLSRRKLSRAAILWCTVATFVAIHALYFPATRYRGPMEFVVLLYASVALDYVSHSTHWPRPEESPAVS